MDNLNYEKRGKTVRGKTREKTIEQYLRVEVKKVGGIAYKFISPGRKGVPDRLILLPGGKVWFVELKAQGKRLTPLQKQQQHRLASLGFEVLTIDSKQGVDDFMSMIKK